MQRILYVEDNTDTAGAVKMILTNAGFETHIASSGGECLSKAEKEHFDLFLLDLMLPDMSGWDIFQKLRKFRVNAKYIFLSVVPVTTERMIELRKAGVSDYITKPFTKVDLIERINKVL
ncbi:response regulator [Candidatus Woesearchaeota archaeon]|nr:response regulator [Candidatus Woesearchaeota archaeon]